MHTQQEKEIVQRLDRIIELLEAMKPKEIRIQASNDPSLPGYVRVALKE